MVPPRNTDFKVETYQRLIALTKTRLSKIKIAVDNLYVQTESLTVVELKTLNAYMTELQKKKDDFELNLQRVIMVSDEDALSHETLSADQDEINDLYIHISSHIESLVVNEKLITNSDNSIDNGSLTTSHSQVRLPKFELPKFSGDLNTWTSFINLYDTTIHNNGSLSDVMKFQYLLSALEKEPLNLIRSLNLTAPNYTVAYNLLRDRYHNTRRLQLVHLNNLLDLPQVTSSHISGVRQFVNVLNENTQALIALECDVLNSDSMLVAILLRKMDVELRTRLEAFRATLSSTKHTLPTAKEIIDFLTNECTHLEDATMSQGIRTMGISSSTNHSKTTYHTKPVLKKTVSMVATQFSPQTNHNYHTPTPCFACNEVSHKIYACLVFKSKTPQERFQLVKQHKKCVSCLGPHDTKSCKSQSTCKMCNKRHHTLLHFNGDGMQNRGNYSSAIPNSCPEKRTTVCQDLTPKSETSVILTSQNDSLTSSVNTTVLLGTLLVQITSPDGNSHVFRALLDSGSMCNLITEYAANILNVRRHKSDVQLSGIDHHVTDNKGQIFVHIKTLSGRMVASNQPTLILDRLTVDLPRIPLANDLLKRTRSYILADPTFHIPNRIDFVIGGSLFPQLFTQEQYSLGPNMPYVLGTHFGYVLMGTAPCIPSTSKPSTTNPSCTMPSTTLNVCLHSTNDADLHSSVQRFWLQEEPPMCSIKTREEQLCDQTLLRHIPATSMDVT